MLFTLSIILENHMIWPESAVAAEFRAGRGATRRDHLRFVHE